MEHILLLSGGHSSALVAIEAVRKFGKENCRLLNHDINPKKEDADIKRFKNEVANYLGMNICYANVDDITNPDLLPNQFDVCIKAGALTSPNGDVLCTALLKTIPFYRWLNLNFYPYDTLFEAKKDCIVYYGFDASETARITRRSSIMAAMGYKTAYPLFNWKERTIFNTEEIGIKRPNTYAVYKHANCKGCLKASLLHWYVVYVNDPEIYVEGIFMEKELNYTIHTVVRNGVKTPISLTELAPIFEALKLDSVPATEHQSMIKFANRIREYQIQEVAVNKPCECLI